MQFEPPLLPAKLIRRYKRFLADVELPSGEIMTLHCPNTGAMLNCLVPDSDCWYSTSDNPKRKYPCTLDIVTTTTGHLAGINTGRANSLVREALEAGAIEELAGYPSIKAEVKYGEENSRIDFLLSADDRPDCYVEVKSVTLGLEGGQGLFPDAVSTRGVKHLRELMAMVEQGHRAVLFYCVQHTGIERVSPADDIDPVYGEMLRKALTQGVEVIAYGATLSASEICLGKRLPVNC